MKPGTLLLLLWSALVPMLGGCATIRETHYFQKEIPGSPGQANFFRLKVSGYSWFSSARYIAGFYDERAIDLFFNEVKSGQAAPGGQGDGAAANAPAAREGIRPVFIPGAKLPGTDETVKPLKDPGDGTFLMLFSTNASDVADAIGQFAENQITADALSSIVNRTEIRETAGRQDRADRRLAGVPALTAELDALFGLLPADAPPPVDDTNRAMLRILNALARGLGNTGSFQSTEQARGWFAGLRR